MSLDRLKFTPTREAGLERLAAFVPRAGRWYANHGGLDHGPDRRANTAGLSPWLTCRLVRPEEAIAAVEAEHGAAASTAFRQEAEATLRRRAWLTARPGVWRAHRQRVERLFRAMSKSASLLAAYDEAVEGRTGVDAFDAWARELAEIGWLHPAALRAFASVWIFSLRLPWELGADLHHRSALDGEPAGLALWRETAGLQPGTPHYAVTADEIAALSAGRFQPKRRLIEEQARPLEPAAAAQNSEAFEEVETEATGDRIGWLLTDSDLSPPPEDLAPVAVAGLSTALHRSPFGPTATLVDWTEGGLADALARQGRPGERLDDADWTVGLERWRAAHSLDQVRTSPFGPGPAADRLRAFRRSAAVAQASAPPRI